MKSICGVEGVTASGIKEGKYGLALIRAGGSAAGVFTSNLVRAPPIILMEERIRRGTLEAVIVNSGCANAYTGRRGYADALRRMRFWFLEVAVLEPAASEAEPLCDVIEIAP